jgi:hypothetical protein
MAKRDAKTAERKRKATIKEIKDKVKSKRTILSRQGNKWVGKTTVDAQKEYFDFSFSISFMKSSTTSIILTLNLDKL